MLTEQEREARALDDIMRRVHQAFAKFQNWCRRMDDHGVQMTRSERNEIYRRDIGME